MPILSALRFPDSLSFKCLLSFMSVCVAFLLTTTTTPAPRAGGFLSPCAWLKLSPFFPLYTLPAVPPISRPCFSQRCPGNLQPRTRDNFGSLLHPGLLCKASPTAQSAEREADTFWVLERERETVQTHITHTVHGVSRSICPKMLRMQKRAYNLDRRLGLQSPHFPHSIC